MRAKVLIAEYNIAEIYRRNIADINIYTLYSRIIVSIIYIYIYSIYSTL